jgi:hypothetical protein
LSTTETENKKLDIKFDEEKTSEAFTKEGLESPYFIQSGLDLTSKFKAKFRPEKAPLQIIIKTMNRRSVIQYDENGKAIKKEFLTYRADYHGRDFLGNDIWLRSHSHGQYKRPRFRTTMEMNYETGEHMPRKEFDGTEDVYTIELTDKNRKQVIEDIINNSNGTIVDEILFYGHFLQSLKGIAFRCPIFTHDQFINCSMEELEKIGRSTPSPAIRYLDKDKKNYHG